MKKILIVAAAVIAAGNAKAQKEELAKQMEVTREYAPKVAKATKLPIDPDLTDTVRIKPEISYRINSTASATSFRTQAYQQATLATTPIGGEKPMYVRAAVGVPLVTKADLYFTPRMKKAGRAFGLYANHAGSYSKITNDLGAEADATEMTNGGGLWGARQWRRYSFEGDVSYDNRMYNPYGVADVDHNPASSVARERAFVYDKQMHRFALGLARAGVSLGDNFTNLSRFNFRIAVDGGYARFAKGDAQVNLDARITLAKMFGEGRHGFEVVMAENGAFLPGDKSGEGDRKEPMINVAFTPTYRLDAGNLSLRAGADIRYIVNKAHNQNRAVFGPSIDARVNFESGAFVPFVNFTSRIIEGDREALSRRNPYVVMRGTTAWVNDARIGFSGDLNDILSYRLSGGLSMLNDYQIFVGTQLATPRSAGGATGVDYPPMWFTPHGADGEQFTVGAEIAMHNVAGMGVKLYGNWNKFDFRRNANSSFDPVGDLPKYDAGVELSYGYKGIVAIKASAEFIGEREYLVLARGGASEVYSKRTIAPVIDVTFGAEVRVSPDFWVFLEGENLANQVLYPYPHYRGLGASVMGGVKIVF